MEAAVAGALAQTVVQGLLGRISLLLEKKVALVIGVRTEFRAIKDELESMTAFLRDADKRSEIDNEVQTWVAQVRDAAFDVEDIIDEFMYQVDHQFSDGNLSGHLNLVLKLPKHIWVKHQMASKLEKVKANIREIKERHQRYNFLRQEEEGGVRFQRHREPPLSAEDNVVGIDDYEKLLLDWLQRGQQQLSLLSVLGMGGSGKTTIVAKVYNSKEVKKYFQCYAWVTLSKEFVVENLFKCMIKDFYKAEKDLVPTDLDKMDYNDLVETIKDYLQQKRYLIVLDDVWNLDMDLWRRIKAAIPQSESNGSAIVLTTRNMHVAKFQFEVRKYILHVKPLPDGKAWELFCRKAFFSNVNRHCPQQLKDTAQELVKKCRGLPLTILVMANLMSSKNHTELEWKKACQSPNWEISNNPTLESCKSILLLSYHSLTYHLRQCFKYCCVFPEDYLIKRKRLIRLWIAEGFVETREGKTLEEVADTYLEELVCRSMLEVVTKNHSGRAKTMRLHDLLREIGLSISKGERFSVLYNRDEAEKARRLAIQKSDKIPQEFDLSKLCSLFVFGTETTMLNQSYELPEKLKFLRVLDLQGILIAMLPDVIADLFCLRYLNLRGTRIKEVPKALGKLWNLQTLDICDTEVEALPTSMEHLQNLRNLLMYHYDLRRSDSFSFVRGTRVSFDISKLKSIQVLASIEANDDSIRLIGNLTQLRRIGITKVKYTQVQQLCTSIQKLNHLKSLFLMASNDRDLLQIDPLNRPPPNLERLILVGKLNLVPRWFDSLNALTFLFLKYSKLQEDLLPKIHALNNLCRLTLSNAYEGELLHFQPKWFPVLKILRLWNLSKLSQVKIEKEAMPDIEELWVSGCPKLLMLPKGIEHLRRLKELILDDMPEQFIDQLRHIDGIDRQRVAHIPQINHYYLRSGKMHHESLS